MTEMAKSMLKTKLTLPLDMQIPFTCEICMESKSYSKSFSVKGCSHSYCSDCLAKYIDSKLQHKVVGFRCPDFECTNILDPDNCRPIISEKVFDDWRAALYESSLPRACKLYCPNKTCSALLIIDADASKGPVMVCPNCQQELCVQCRAAWHAGMDCHEFRAQSKQEDQKAEFLLQQLANKHGWKQCPNCNIYISHSDSTSCHIMLCRSCGCGFCYGCGYAYGETRGHIARSRCDPKYYAVCYELMGI